MRLFRLLTVGFGVLLVSNFASAAEDEKYQNFYLEVEGLPGETQVSLADASSSVINVMYQPVPEEPTSGVAFDIPFNNALLQLSNTIRTHQVGFEIGAGVQSDDADVDNDIVDIRIV